jgi:hypothetical protein
MAEFNGLTAVSGPELDELYEWTHLMTSKIRKVC